MRVYSAPKVPRCSMREGKAYNYDRQASSKLRAVYRFRSAIWGYFVTAAYAAKHPKTTVRERIR